MTRQELQEARQLAKKREMLKDPALKSAYEYAQKRAREDKKRKQILNSWGPNGYVPPEIKNPQTRKKTEEEKRIDLNYSRRYKLT